MSWYDNTPKQVKSLMVSAGHSYSDPGAVGNGKSEADIVLDLRDRLAAALEARGVVFGTDGVAGENLPLREAIKRASEYDVAIECHCNSAASSTATGVETLSKPEDYPLGDRLCEAVSKSLGISNRGAKPEGSGAHSRLAFVSDGGGIILEIFFISNPDDMRAYYNNQQAVVSGIADVLVDEVTV